MQMLRVITCSGISHSSKWGGHEWPLKAAKNRKLGVIFAECGPMNPCPPLAQPLMQLSTAEDVSDFLNFSIKMFEIGIFNGFSIKQIHVCTNESFISSIGSVVVDIAPCDSENILVRFLLHIISHVALPVSRGKMKESFQFCQILFTFSQF